MQRTLQVSIGRGASQIGEQPTRLSLDAYPVDKVDRTRDLNRLNLPVVQQADHQYAATNVSAGCRCEPSKIIRQRN